MNDLCHINDIYIVCDFFFHLFHILIPLYFQPKSTITNIFIIMSNYDKLNNLVHPESL